MSSATERWVGVQPSRSYWRWVFVLLVPVVPILVGYTILHQWRTPMLDISLVRPLSDPGLAIVGELVPGGQAQAAGLQGWDILLTVDGFPFDTWTDRRLGSSCTLEILRVMSWKKCGGELPASVVFFTAADEPFVTLYDRQRKAVCTLGIGQDAQQLTLVVPLALAFQVNSRHLPSAVFVVLVFWGVGTLLLRQQFRRLEVRLVFLLAQALAVVLLAGLAYPYRWPIPPWLVLLSTACFHLTPPLFLHYHLTFPVVLGSPRRRRWVFSVLYGLGLLAIVAGISRVIFWMGLAALYSALVSGVVVASVIVYVYLRRASLDDRRRLRVVVLGTLLGLAPPIFGYVLPSILGQSGAPRWVVGVFLVIPPLAYLYATVRHNLFGIDRLLNRTLVYAVLSLGLFALYVGPLFLFYRYLPGEWLPQAAIVAVVTLLVGLTFDQLRTWVQWLVDRLFYGGWYDYPGVVETVSDALARSLDREQLTRVLTHQVPELMQLYSGHLWIGERDQPFPPPTSQSPGLSFPLTFEGQVRGVWNVGPRRDGEGYSASDRRILQTLVRQAETALSNVLLVETLRRRLDDIRKVQRQLLRSREEERARLARDLHDGPIQTLVGLNLQLGLLLAEWDEVETCTTSARETLGAMRAEVRELLSELRQVCAELRPPMLDTLGLGAALRALAEEWSVQYGIVICLNLPPNAALRPLPKDVAVNLYRVVQEALANVARHAVARQVIIALAWQAPHLDLTIRDDGQGFAVPDALQRLTAQGHFGLMGISERVDLIGGRWTVESAPAQGTTIHVIWQRPNVEVERLA